MSEIIQPNDPLYDGEMTAAQFIEAEVEIDEKLPEFSAGEIPLVKLKIGELAVRCHYFNTEVVTYDNEWQKFSHIKIETDQQPIYFFRDLGIHENEDERWTKIAAHLMEQDFPRILPEAKPRPYVLELYWRAIRGEEPIEDVLERIVDNNKG